MPENLKQKKVDDLVNHFWKHGYLTLSRKFGTYLPTPNNIGKYEVDAIGKFKKKYAIGITLSENDLDDPKIYSKLEFLATRQSKYSSTKVTLFVGVPKSSLSKAKLFISNLTTAAQKNIKIVGIADGKESY